jgi:hypothetical protein
LPAWLVRERIAAGQLVTVLAQEPACV